MKMRKHDMVFGTQYELGKRVFSQVPHMSEEDQLQFIHEYISPWARKLYATGERYFMLLCKERSDYTIFHTALIPSDNFGKEVLKVANSRGEVRLIDVDKENNIYEFWMNIDDEVVAYILFPCQDFIVEVIV